MLELQLRALRDAGISEACIMVGFQAEKVEDLLASRPVPGIHVETCFNPFFDSTENLVTAWLARTEMDAEFLLLNGDTLFEPRVLRCLLSAPAAPITLVVNGKSQYDEDDMKVSICAEGRVRAISKKLRDGEVSGESIGLMRFSGEGVDAFQSGLDRAVRSRRGVHSYYLSVIDELSREIPVETALMTGLWWGELDSPEDLARIRVDLEALGSRMDERGGAHPATGSVIDLGDRPALEKPARRPRSRALDRVRRAGL